VLIACWIGDVKPKIEVLKGYMFLLLLFGQGESKRNGDFLA
jgi:hypothetical protein